MAIQRMNLRLLGLLQPSRRFCTIVAGRRQLRPSESAAASLRWLNDLDSPLVQQTIAEENWASDQLFQNAEAAALKIRFKNEIAGYQTHEANESLPERNGRLHDGNSNCIGPEEVVLDMSKIAAEGESLRLGVFHPSRDQHQRFLAYSLDTTGSEDYCLRIRDIHKQTERKKEMAHGVSSAAWGVYRPGQPQVLYYTKTDATKRAASLYVHTINTSTEDDRLVYHEPDDSKHLEVIASKNGELVTLNVSDRDATQVILVDYKGSQHSPNPTLHINTASIMEIPPSEPGERYYVTASGDSCLMVTNRGGAANYKLMMCGLQDFLDALQRKHDIPWKDLVAHREHTIVHDIDVFDRFIIAFETTDGVPTLLCLPLGQDDCEAFPIELPSDVSDVVGAANNDSSSFIFDFSVLSTSQPPREFRFDFRSRTVTLLSCAKVGLAPGRPLFSASDYVSYKIFPQDAHGTSIPITIVHRSDLGIDVDEVKHKATVSTSTDEEVSSEKYLHDWRLERPEDRLGARSFWNWLKKTPPDTSREHTSHRHYPSISEWRHNNPAIVYAYGAYGQNLGVDFTPDRLPLLSRGWVGCFVHARGGGELGRHWYEDGRMLHKQNTFSDVLVATRALITSGLTRSALTSLYTESAGGLIGGVIANAHPGIARAHVMRMPFLDVLNDLKQPDLPLSVPEYLEFGDPANPDVETYIAAYDPMLNVASDQIYPDMFLVGGMEDQRVLPYHPVKFAKLVRQLAGGKAGTEFTEGQAAVLCRVLEGAGHFGGVDHSVRVDEKAEELAFLFMSLGIPLDATKLI